MSLPVIIDTDIGVDDAMAVLFAHRSPEIDLIGITTIFGNASLEDTTLNALYLTERFAIPVPVYRGSSVTLSGESNHRYPAHIHGEDGLGSMRRGRPDVQEASEAASDYLVRIARESPGELTLVSVGRLTNVALAVRKDPSFERNLKQLVMMGGSLGRQGFGNVTPVAEANVFGDPEAADVVCRSAIPTVMVGLDVTQKTIMSENFFTRLSEAGEAGRFIYEMSRGYTEFHRQRSRVDGCYVHDSSAVAYVVEPRLFETTRGSIRVATRGLARGQTIFSPADAEWVVDDWKGVPEKSVCMNVDSERLLSIYAETLTDD